MKPLATITSREGEQPEVLAVVRDYQSFITALRERVRQLNISYSTLDQIAGWADTYATKFLTQEPATPQQPGEKRKTQRTIGPMAFDAIMGALGLKMMVVSDPKALNRVRGNRYFVQKPPSMLTAGKHHPIALRVSRSLLQKISRLGVVARAEKLSRTKRKKIAQMAARARWQRVREQAAVKSECVEVQPEMSDACTRGNETHGLRAHPTTVEAVPQPTKPTGKARSPQTQGLAAAPHQGRATRRPRHRATQR